MTSNITHTTIKVNGKDVQCFNIDNGAAPKIIRQDTDPDSYKKLWYLLYIV